VMKIKHGGCTRAIPLMEIGDPLGGGALAVMWQAIIEARWTDYDDARLVVLTQIAALDSIRKMEPKRPDDHAR